MLSYVKFLKEILSKKRRLEDYETVTLTEEYTAIPQNKLYPKLKDPGNFSIPCLISNMNIDKAFCDLGASVSLMPLSICQKLNVGELIPTTISLQLADRSVKYPVGILENIPIKVGKCFIPVDFVVLKMEEDVQILIILGRPFLATTEAIIDLKNGRLTLKVGYEKVKFNFFRAMTHKTVSDECLRVDVIDKLVEEEFQKRYPEDPLKACIVHNYTVENENKEIVAYEQSLEASLPLPLVQALLVEEL
ncbi:uncharacterized protein LOC110635332 [Hevea brasiliensis]|uniref:uncharacterized protein LOC110635332 n=1 Tax=Hevea brasiliensis TaxID=3981 RepID=UPI0025EC246F|nr:uncharacterized protein LOC110635332 [Hevea brasiliensis]